MSCVHLSFRFFWSVSHWFREFAIITSHGLFVNFPFLGIRRLEHSFCWLPAKLNHLDGFNHPSLMGNDVLLIYKLATAFWLLALKIPILKLEKPALEVTEPNLSTGCLFLQREKNHPNESNSSKKEKHIRVYKTKQAWTITSKRKWCFFRKKPPATYMSGQMKW